jgi:hypothetical protein
MKGLAMLDVTTFDISRADLDAAMREVQAWDALRVRHVRGVIGRLNDRPAPPGRSWLGAMLALEQYADDLVSYERALDEHASLEHLVDLLEICRVQQPAPLAEPSWGPN